MKKESLSDKSVTKAPLKEAELSPPAEAATAEPAQNITGRAVFVVDTAAAGIVVRTAFLGEQGQLIDMPAVFPDLGYALGQIDHLRQIVMERFSQAAQVGVQVIAANAAQQNASAAPAPQAEPAAEPASP